MDGYKCTMDKRGVMQYRLNGKRVAEAAVPQNVINVLSCPAGANAGRKTSAGRGGKGKTRAASPKKSPPKAASPKAASPKKSPPKKELTRAELERRLEQMERFAISVLGWYTANNALFGGNPVFKRALQGLEHNFEQYLPKDEE